MRSDGESFATRTEWDHCLHEMAEVGRAYIYEGYKEHLTLLGLIFLQRRNRLTFPNPSKDSLRDLRALAVTIENNADVPGRPLSEHLLAGLRSIESKVLDVWLGIALRGWAIEGFPGWFTLKLDQLLFVNHHDTPSSLSRLVASLLLDRTPNAVLDPACGTGGLLAAIAEKEIQAPLFGQESNSEAWALANLRSLILGLKNIELTRSDGLIDRSFTHLTPPEGGFDIVLSNPPFGTLPDSKVMPSLIGRPSNRIGKLSSEGAHIREIMSRLSSLGKAAVLVPNGFLSRGGADQKLREALVEADTVQAVVGLPERLFAPGTTIETAILLLNRQKQSHQKERALFIDARRLGQREGIRVVLNDSSSEQIRARCSNWRDEKGFSQIISFRELDPTSTSLSPTRYVKPFPPSATISRDDRRALIKELDERYAMLLRQYEELRLKLDQPNS